MMADRLVAGRYRLGELLGRGGMSEVYAAQDERLERSVAVKLLRPELAIRDDVRLRFEVEARAAAGLAHPNVVGVYDTGEDEGLPFIVMERLPGETLGDRIASGGVDPAWLRARALEVLSALGAAHAAGIVHRDVKPGNILIASNGHAKIADFGIAKSIERLPDEVELTGTNLLVGTPAYVAPERMAGNPATPASDIYSMGVVLYEALAGGRPADGVTLPTGSDPAMIAAIDRSLRPNPLDRFATADEMAAALTPSAAAPTVVGGLDDQTIVGAPIALRPRSRPLGAWIAVVLGILLLGGIAVAAAMGDGGDEEPGATTTTVSTTAPPETTTTPTTRAAPATTDPPERQAERRAGDRDGEGDGEGDGNGKRKGKGND